MFGERKGSFSAIATEDAPRRSLLESRLSEITQNLSDPWPSVVASLDDPGAIISERDEQIALYLGNIMMLWRLGLKPATYEEITTSRAVLHH